MKVAITILLFFTVVSTYSTNLGEFFGRYESIDPENGVSFILDAQGVSNLVINGIVIDYPTLKYDYLGVTGGALNFIIRFNDGRKYSVIRLLIVNYNREIVLTVGYYIQSKIDDVGDSTLLKTQTLELIFTPAGYTH